MTNQNIASSGPFPKQVSKRVISTAKLLLNLHWQLLRFGSSLALPVVKQRRVTGLVIALWITSVGPLVAEEPVVVERPKRSLALIASPDRDETAKVPSGTEVLELLGRGDRADLSDNRLTSYSFDLGGGSLHYWDGQNIGGDLALAWEDLAVELRRPDGSPRFHRLLYLNWQPDRIKAWHTVGREFDIIERKTIVNDVFVSELTFCYCNQHARERRPLQFNVVLKGHARGKHLMAFDNGVLHIDEKDRQAHRIIGLARGRELRQVDVASPAFQLQTPVSFEGFTTELEHEERDTVYVVCSVADDYREAQRKFTEVAAHPEEAFERRTAEWVQYYEKAVPNFTCDEPIVQKLFYHSYFVSFANTYDFGRGFFQRPFSSLGKFRLLPQWYWDTAFHSLYEKWLNDMPLPQSAIKNLVLWNEVGDQVRSELKQRGLDGKKYIPRDDQLPFTLDINSFVFGKLIDPQAIPFAIWDIYLQTGDVEFLKQVYEPLKRYDRWLEENRDPGGEHLINIVHQGESGWDNSRRFLPNKILKYVTSPLTNEGKVMQSPDFNTYYYLSKLVLAKMAQLVGDEQSEAGFREQARKTRQAIQTLWDEELGLYVDRYTADHAATKVKTPGGMIPMLGGIPDKEQVKRIVAHLVAPDEFWSDYPLPSLSMDNEVFNVRDEYQSYWNGRMWPQVNWLVIEGLVRYEHYDIARQLALKTLASMNRTGQPAARENYDPVNGGPFRKHSTNTFNYGWGALGADIIIRRLLGVQGHAAQDTLMLDPLFPEQWSRAQLGDIRIGEHQLSLAYTRHGNLLQCEVTHIGPRPLTVVTPTEQREVADGSARFVFPDDAHLGMHWLDSLEP